MGTDLQLRRLPHDVHRIWQILLPRAPTPLLQLRHLLPTLSPAIPVSLRRRRRYGPSSVADRLAVELSAHLAASVGELALDVRDDEVDGAFVVHSGDDHVGEAAEEALSGDEEREGEERNAPTCRLQESVKRGLDIGEVLVNHSDGIPSSFRNVPLDPPRKHQVRVALDENPQIQNVAEVLVEEDKQSLHEDDARTIEVRRLLGSVVLDERVVGDLYALAVLHVLDALDQDVVVERIGRVKVVLAAEGGAGLFGGEGLVEVVCRS